MEIKKVKDTYNTYKVELSYGQLVAVRNALEKDHADPVSDELYAELNYYLANIPGPGEDPDEFKEKRDEKKNPDKPKDDPDKPAAKPAPVEKAKTKPTPEKPSALSKLLSRKESLRIAESLLPPAPNS